MRETHEGKVVWEGEVQVFEVAHPRVTRIYAWSHESGPVGKRRFHAARGAHPVDSPEKAVRVAVFDEFKRAQN